MYHNIDHVHYNIQLRFLHQYLEEMHRYLRLLDHNHLIDDEIDEKSDLMNVKEGQKKQKRIEASLISITSATYIYIIDKVYVQKKETNID